MRYFINFKRMDFNFHLFIRNILISPLFSIYYLLTPFLYKPTITSRLLSSTHRPTVASHSPPPTNHRSTIITHRLLTTYRHPTTTHSVYRLSIVRPSSTIACRSSPTPPFVIHHRCLHPATQRERNIISLYKQSIL